MRKRQTAQSTETKLAKSEVSTKTKYTLEGKLTSKG